MQYQELAFERLRALDDRRVSERNRLRHQS